MRLKVFAAIAISSLLIGNVFADSGRKVALDSPAAADLLLKKDLAYLTAPVKTRAQLAPFLKPDAKSPLNYLSNAARGRFIASLTFGDNGLSGFSYEDLEAELTVSQIYEVLAMFGEQHNAYRFDDARVETDFDREILSTGLGIQCIQPPVEPESSTTAPQTVAPACYDFLEDYRCEKRGTCIISNLRACTSNC